jgi:hypothetical protein
VQTADWKSLDGNAGGGQPLAQRTRVAEAQRGDLESGAVESFRRSHGIQLGATDLEGVEAEPYAYLGRQWGVGRRQGRERVGSEQHGIRVGMVPSPLILIRGVGRAGVESRRHSIAAVSHAAPETSGIPGRPSNYMISAARRVTGT